MFRPNREDKENPSRWSGKETKIRILPSRPSLHRYKYNPSAPIFSTRSASSNQSSSSIPFASSRPSLVQSKTSSIPSLFPSSGIYDKSNSSPSLKKESYLQPKDSASPSSRPKVPAGDRLFSWKTPFSHQFDLEINSILPTSLSESFKSTIASALAPSTRSAYGAGILRFCKFCDRFDIPEEQRMPASNILLAAFVSDHAGKCSSSCMKNWMSGLRAWHELNGAQWHGDDKLVNLSRTLVDKEGGKFCRIDITMPAHAAFWALALTAFWGCRRLGEFTVPSESSFDPKFHVRKISPTFNSSSSDCPPSISFDLPWTKSSREKGGTVILSARDDMLCPVSAFLNHFLINAALPKDLPLFAYTQSSGKTCFPIKSEFLAFCKLMQADPSARIFGHSFRIGGTVELLMAGVPPQVVASLGGWSSNVFLVYWRKLERIIPLHISQAYDKQKIKKVFSVIESSFLMDHKL